MSNRLNFRTPIYGAGGKFKKFVYWPAVYGAPAVTCREGDVFKAPEQCTGQKDEKGRMIYENDIVKINGFNGANGPDLYQKNIHVVEFWKDGCGFYPMCDYDSYLGIYTHSSDCEVIGNIHENPELLEGKK